jgi:hypothetical protein
MAHQHYQLGLSDHGSGRWICVVLPGRRWARAGDSGERGAGGNAVESGAAGGVGGGGAMSWSWLADLKKAEIVLAIIAIGLSMVSIVVPIVTFLLGLRFGRREREEDQIGAAARDTDCRVDQVVQSYAELVQNGRTGDLHGLPVAGIKNLRSSEEILLARTRATARTAGDPLRPYAVDDAKLKEFIDAAQFDGLKVTNDRELREQFCEK